MPTTTTAMTTTAMPSMRPMRATSFCSGVGSSCGGVEHAAAIAPISVSMPVAVTTARPVPCATAVPLKTMFSAVAERRRLAQACGVLEHGLALAGERGFLHAQRAACSSRASAPTASPSPSTSTSPRTSSALGTRAADAVAHDGRVTAVMRASAATAFSALASCT